MDDRTWAEPTFAGVPLRVLEKLGLEDDVQDAALGEEWSRELFEAVENYNKGVRQLAEAN